MSGLPEETGDRAVSLHANEAGLVGIMLATWSQCNLQEPTLHSITNVLAR